MALNKDQLAEKGRRAAEAHAEFIAPAIETIRAEYMEALTRLAASEPWRSDKIVKLAIAARVIDAVSAQMRAAMANGQAAQSDINRAREIEDLPAAKRRWLNI